MSTRRTTAAMAATALVATALSAAPLAGLGGPAGAAVDDTPGYSVRAVTVDVLVGPGDDQPCTVVADLYVPDRASVQRKAPAVLTTHGFGGAKDDARQRAYATGFVQEGYVVLSYSGLGFGGSGCKITLDDPDYDGKAGSQLVSVLAGEKDFTDLATGQPDRVEVVATERAGDPRVGMIGVSYGGQIQYSVAMQDPRVDAIIPIITWNDLAYSLAPNNTGLAGSGVTYATPGVHKRLWTDLFFTAGIVDGVNDPQTDPRRLAGCPNFADQACAALVNLQTQGYPDDSTLALARHASVASYVDRIRIPTLIVQGQRDTLFNLQESVATYRALRAQGTEARLVWQQGGHSGAQAPGEFSFDQQSLRDSYLGRRFLDWMDRYVRDDRRVSPGPRFEYFRDWVDYDTSAQAAGTAVAKAFARKKLFGQRPTATYWLSGGDRLVSKRTAVQAGEASYANAPGGAPTSYSETSSFEGSTVDQPVSDRPGTFAAFTSDPLTRPATLVGSPTLTLHLDAPLAAGTQQGGPMGQLILFAKLYDVAPDGSVQLKDRLVSPVRVADVGKPVRVQLPAVVHRFAKGHRLQLVVAASDFAYANNPVVHPVTVTTSPERPGTLQLPLTGRRR